MSLNRIILKKLIKIVDEREKSSFDGEIKLQFLKGKIKKIKEDKDILKD